MRAQFIFVLLALILMLSSTVYAHADPKKHGSKAMNGKAEGREQPKVETRNRRRKRDAASGLIATVAGVAAPATGVVGGVTGLVGGVGGVGGVAGVAGVGASKSPKAPSGQENPVTKG